MYGAPHEQYFYVNNWKTKLTAAILASDTVLPIQGNYVDLLDTPAPSSTRRYLATLDDGAGTREIIEITGRNTAADTITVVRAREGTTAAAFPIDTTIEMRITALTASLLGIGGIDAGGNIFLGAQNPGASLDPMGSFDNMLIGSAAGIQLTAAAENTVLGAHTLERETTGSGNTALGASALRLAELGTTECTAVGYNAGASPSAGMARATFIGAFADAVSADGTHDVLCLGYGALARASNQGVIGSEFAPITDVYIGEGVEDGTPPASVTLNATGGAGTDVAGAPLRLAGGRGTGTGAGGKVLIATAPAGGVSNNVQNALIDRAEWDATGLMWTYAGLKTGDPGSGAGVWKLGTVVAGAVALDTAAYVEVDIGGSVVKLLKAA